MFVEQSLVLGVLPKECQVDDANGLPKVANLFTCAVDDVGYFVSCYKFQILNWIIYEKWLPELKTHPR